MWTGIILAGGPNRRMNGASKALLRFGEETLLQRQVKEMKSVCEEVIVVSNDPKPLLRILDRDVRIITDFYASKGPLVGMHAGFTLASNPHVWAVGCDMPFISARAAEVLREKVTQGCHAAVPMINGGVYPLHAVYNRACVEQVIKLIERGETSASSLLKEVYWGEVTDSAFINRGIDLKFIKNINTSTDYQDLLKQMEQGEQLAL
jgi:molybdenum cofactor guanylyltransferase